MEQGVRAAGGEFVLTYASGLSGGDLPVADVSSQMDSYGFTDSWRISDNSLNTIWNAQQNGNWLFNYFPNGWIINTQTMEMIASVEYGPSFDIISIIESL